MAVQTEPLEGFRSEFSGVVLAPDESGYDEARRIHNGLIDKHPRLIARCLNTADIVDAVKFAREEDLEISVKGGGHNPAGRSVTDGGLMIDLSFMKGIHVDPAARKVRAQGGVTWAEFNRATALHGLAVTGGAISSTGIAGLTLGGGLGWLMSSYGMAVDNVTSMELVTAEGEVLTLSEDENPDLFWACRGGGGNFGVVSSFEYQLHPLSMVTGGLIAHPFPAAGDVLRFYRDFTADVGDDLTVFAGLVHAPDGSGMKLSALLVCHVGTPEEAERDLEPLKTFGEPAMVEVGPMPYPVINTLLDEGFPSGALNYWKSSFLENITDEYIDTVTDKFAACPSPMGGIVIEHFHGQVTRFDPTATAFPHRDRSYNNLIIGQWVDPADTKENTLWVKDTYNSLEPFFSSSRYVNYLDDDEQADAVPKAYGVVYDRLVEVKRRYDPDNVFHLNQNIDPS
jgi:FAD/FMN-containing dehydrogenase